MATSEADVAAKLIERLLVDPAFRARFRRNPAEACREAGLDELAQEMSIGAGKAMMTLDMRESKSSLAGVMMAAAMEGVGVMQFVEHVAPHLDDIPEAIGDVLSRVNLPAIGGALAPSPPPSAPAAAPDGGAAGADGVAGADAGVDAAPAAAATAPPPAAAAPPPPRPRPRRGRRRPDAPAAAKPEPKTAAEEAAEKIAKEESPETKSAEAGQKAAADIAEDAKDLPSATDLPDDRSRAEAVRRRRRRAAGGGAARLRPAPGAAAPRLRRPRRPRSRRGRAGPPASRRPAASGSVEAAAKALLENKNLVLDADAQKDIRSGEVDPRMIGLLTKLTEKHKIELSVIKTGHGQFTSGGSVSNHFVGRGIDIARVDGEIVNAGSTAARELATEIAGAQGRPAPDRGRIAVGDRGVGLLHRRRPPGPSARRLRRRAAGRLRAAGLQGGAGRARSIRLRLRPAAPAAAPAAPVAAAAAAPAAPVAAAAGAAGAEGGRLGPVRGGEGAGGEQEERDSGQFLAAAQPPPAAAAPPRRPGRADAVAAAADLGGIGDAYPGDDAPKEQLAAWLGKQAEKRGLPKELPVMAALVESGVKNLNFGDADSVGFFQMRVGIWNQGEYAGYPEKPELQAKWFLDQAEAVKKQRIVTRPARRRPEPVRRVDRRRRAARRAVPRPLPAAPRRGARGSSARPPRSAPAGGRRGRPGRRARPPPPLPPRPSPTSRRPGRAGRPTRRSTASTARAASRRRRWRRCSRTRTSPSTPPASPTSRRARSTRA